MLVQEADRLLEDYGEFKDMQSLDRVRAIQRVLAEKFQISRGEGAKGKKLDKLMRDESEFRSAAELSRHQAAAKPIIELAEVMLLDGEDYSAAVLLAHIVHSLPSSPQAAEAKKMLRKIEQSHPDVVEVLKQLQIGGR